MDQLQNKFQLWATSASLGLVPTDPRAYGPTDPRIHRHTHLKTISPTGDNNKVFVKWIINDVIYNSFYNCRHMYCPYIWTHYVMTPCCWPKSQMLECKCDIDITHRIFRISKILQTFTFWPMRKITPFCTPPGYDASLHNKKYAKNNVLKKTFFSNFWKKIAKIHFWVNLKKTLTLHIYIILCIFMLSLIILSAAVLWEVMFTRIKN